MERVAALLHSGHQGRTQRALMIYTRTLSLCQAMSGTPRRRSRCGHSSQNTILQWVRPLHGERRQAELTTGPGLETIKIQDLVEVDRTYKERIDLRRQLMDTHPIATLAARPGSDEMVHEFYAWMMGTYLPLRWPSMYSLSPAKSTPPTHLHNLATHEEIPLESRSTLDALRTLGAHVDTDFLFMLASPNDGKYHLEAFVNCFPAGFSTREKLGLPLAAIHAPVPGYAAKLEKSMDRFFANLPLGKLVKRANWSLTTTAELFLESGNHLYDEKQSTKSEVNHGPGTESERNSESELAQLRAGVNIPDCRLRCERQTLHRLPKTNALVFAFKTYQYTLPELKEEGSGQELADAIDGLTKGNVPEMAYYKRGVVWGDKVKEYLTS